MRFLQVEISVSRGKKQIFSKMLWIVVVHPGHGKRIQQKKPSHLLPLQTHAFLSHKPFLPSSCLALNLTWLAQMYSLVSDIMLD